MAAEPLTVVVRRRVKPGAEQAFETAMQGFIRFALAFAGNSGINVLRPEPGSERVYTVVDRFDGVSARRAFQVTPEYAEWMRRLGELTDGEPQIAEIGGLGGWFTPPGAARASKPSQLKMAAVTFIGVLPLTAGLPPLLGSMLPGWHVQLVNVVVTMLIVVLLTWVVMPLLTRLFSRWLFAERN